MSSAPARPAHSVSVKLRTKGRAKDCANGRAVVLAVIVGGVGSEPSIPSQAGVGKSCHAPTAHAPGAQAGMAYAPSQGVALPSPVTLAPLIALTLVGRLFVTARSTPEPAFVFVTPSLLPAEATLT